MADHRDGLPSSCPAAAGRRSGFGHWRALLEGERASRPLKRPHRRSRRSTHWGIDTNTALAIPAPTRHAWLLLAAVADPALPWSTPSERRKLPMKPTSLPFACPLIREQAFPIAFLARPQLLTR